MARISQGNKSRFPVEQVQFIKNVQDSLADRTSVFRRQLAQLGFLTCSLLPQPVPDGRIAHPQPCQLRILPAEGIPPGQKNNQNKQKKKPAGLVPFQGEFSRLEHLFRPSVPEHHHPGLFRQGVSIGKDAGFRIFFLQGYTILYIYYRLFIFL